ncbi:MAG: hypothetical protein PHF72_02340 [Gammaproteobacteria bacterium]|nr:hypothetical protein [Gammaproteobacteria bacterium]
MALMSCILVSSLALTGAAHECGKAERALRIEYRVHDAALAEGYRRSGAPAEVRGPERRVLILRGDHRWERLAGRYWILDARRLKRESATMVLRGLAESPVHLGRNGSPAPELPHRIEEREIIRIDTPEFSLEYEPAKGRGRLLPGARELAAGSSARTGIPVLARWMAGLVADQLALTPLGETRVAGHRCRRLATGERKGERMTTCIADIDGHQVPLETRLERAAGDYVETALWVNEDACAADVLFTLPVEFRHGLEAVGHE